MNQPIVGYHLDDVGDWVADLACGHGQHVRHQPPFFSRPWVLMQEARSRQIGQLLFCKHCHEPDVSPPVA